MGLFGSKPAKVEKNNSQVTAHDKAILDLKRSRDRLKRYQTKLQTESAQLDKQAIMLMRAGKKNRALLCIKMKKMKEKQVDSSNEQLLNLVQMVDSVEWETQQLQVFEGLKQGNQMLDTIHKQMTVTDVEALMDETDEAIALEQEISGLLSGAGMSDAFEEEELLEELQQLEAAQTPTAAPSTATPAAAAAAAAAADAAAAASELDKKLPDAPSGKVEVEAATLPPAAPEKRQAVPA